MTFIPGSVCCFVTLPCSAVVLHSDVDNLYLRKNCKVSAELEL